MIKKLLAVFGLVLFFSVACFAAHLTGYVSDEQCAVRSSKAAKASDWVNPKGFESCAQRCAKNGSAMVFVTEDNKVLKIDASSAKKAGALLGHRVSVDGEVENGTLKIDKIAGIEMEPQTKANDQEEHTH
ncbi:MAG TPA: hypothetical protein VI488_05720 [Candidatus Angelobacter sp.]